MSLISHPYGDSSAPYLGTAILTILCERTRMNQEPVTLYYNCSTPLGDTDKNNILKQYKNINMKKFY